MPDVLNASSTNPDAARQPGYRTLHLIGCSPSQGDSFADALALVDDQDAVLLLQDAVYALLPGLQPAWHTLRARNIPCFALQDDMVLRGVTLDTTGTESTGIRCVDYAGFVRLVTVAAKTCSWF